MGEIVRPLVKGVVILAAFMCGFGCTAAVASVVGQHGRRTDSAVIDGTASGVIGNSFNPRSGQCVLYSILIYNESDPHMVETGLVRCTGATIDGTCTGGHGFAERYTGVSLYCNQGNSFTNGTRYNPGISRDSSTSFSGAVLGVSIAQGGFPTSDSIHAYAWGEATGGSSCPTSGNSGSFRDWQRFITGSGWAIISAPPVFHGGTLPGAPCLSVGSYSAGDFDVS